MKSRRVVAGARTSLPRWPERPPGVDPAAASLTVLAIGDAAEDVAAAWARQARDAGIPLQLITGGPGALGAGDADPRSAADLEVRPALAAALATALVGWRLHVAGPEDDVLVARRDALAAGAVPAEIIAVVTSTTHRRVHCAHCRRVTRAVTAPGETVTCPGCATLLLVHPHVSSPLAAYLGARADAESAS